MAGSAVGKIKASRVNNLDAAEYIGPVGQMWYDTETGVLRLGDNVTPGGTIVGGGGGGGSPGTPNRSLQFNSGGAFAGDANLLYNNSTATLSLTGNLVVSRVTATGNVSAQYFVGNGALLTGIASSYGNVDVSNYLASGTDTADIVTTANVSGGNILTVGKVSATGNVQGQYVLGNGAFLTGITAGTNYSNANVAAYLPTYTGVVTASSVSATGNVTGSFIKGDGSLLTNLPAGNYSNANVAAYLPTYSGAVTAATVTATGNIAGQFFIGNGSQLTGIVATSSYGNANVATYLSSGLLSTNIVTTGQANAAQVNATTVSATANVTGGNVRTAGQVSATGNIQGNYFIGNGSQLTGLPAGYANSNVASYLSSGTVATDILTTANVSATGFVYGNGSFLTGITGGYANSNVAAYLSSGTVSTNIQTTAIVQGGSVTATGTVQGTSISATGTVSGATISTAGAVTAATVSATGQVTGNNVVALGQVSAIGNVTAQNFIGNGAALTGIPTGQVLITSNITSLTAGQALNIESIYGNAQYPGGIFRFYQSAAPRPTLTLTNTWSATGATSKNAYANYAGNVVNSSGVTINLGISTPATFAIQSSDDITIGNTVITGANITGLGITGTGGTYTIAASLIGNATSIAASSAVTANLSTSAGNGVGATGTTLTTVAPVPFSLSSISASFANTTITPGLGNSQPMRYNVTAGTGTILSGNIIISGAANLTTSVGTSLIGNTANINSTAGNFVVTGSYLGTGLFGAGNSVANVSANVSKVIESTPMFIKSTPTSDNPNFVPTDTNFGNNWVPAPGAPGNTYGFLTNYNNPIEQYYWMAIPDADFWSYGTGVPGEQPNLYYNYTLTGLGTVNNFFNAAYGNGTDTFGGSGGTVFIGSVPYVVLGFNGFANIDSPSNPANLFQYISTSSTN